MPICQEAGTVAPPETGDKIFYFRMWNICVPLLDKRHAHSHLFFHLQNCIETSPAPPVPALRLIWSESAVPPNPSAGLRPLPLPKGRGNEVLPFLPLPIGEGEGEGRGIRCVAP